MTGLFTPQSELMIMWHCFLEQRDPAECFNKIEEFRKYQSQVKMHEQAKRKLEKSSKK